MVPGLPRYIACPHCNCLEWHETGLSGNTFGALQWTDCKMEAPMHLQPPAVARCHGCSRFYWLQDAREVNEPHMKWGESEFFRWREQRSQAVQVRPPSEAEYYHAIQAGLGQTPEQLRILRMLAWWRSNDRSRHRGPKWAALQTMEEGIEAAVAKAIEPQTTTAWRENLEALSDLLDESDEPQRLMKAEVARHLGRFNEAIRLLAWPFATGYRHQIRVIADLCQQQRTEVCLVRGDEGLTAAEKEQAEQRRCEQAARDEERRARLEAEYREEKQVERTRVASAVQEGKLCPRCGFAYQWDGVRCGHCHYRSSD